MVLEAFYAAYWGKIEQHMRRWPEFWRPEVQANIEYRRSEAGCSMPPRLSSSEVIRATRLSKGTVTTRLRELVSERSLLHKWKGRTYTLNRPIEWLKAACAPTVHIKLSRGRPRKPLQPEEELRVMSELQRLPQSEINFLKSQGLRFNQTGGGAIVRYFHSTGTDPDLMIGQAVSRMRKQRKLERFVKTQKKRAGLK
jgi:hypothetical protein